MRVVLIQILVVAVTNAQQFAIRRPRPPTQPLQEHRRQQFIDGVPPFGSRPPPPQRFRPRPPPPGPRRPPNTFFRKPQPALPVRRPIGSPPPRPPPVDFQAPPDNFQNQRPEQTEFEPFPIPNHLGGVGGLPLNPRPEFNNPHFVSSEGPNLPGEDIIFDDLDFITIDNDSGGPPTPPEGFLSEDPQLQLQAKSSPEPLSTSSAPAAIPQSEMTDLPISSSSLPPPRTTTTTTTPVQFFRQSQQQQQRQEVLIEVARPQRQSLPSSHPFNNNVEPNAPQSLPPKRQFRPKPLESNDIHNFIDSVPRQEAQEAREQVLQQDFLGDYQDVQLRPDSFYDDVVDYDVEVDDDEEQKPDRLALLLLNSTFTCMGMKGGYYADEEVQCEVFHYCQDNIKHSWLCPEGASFHQVHLICMPRTEDNICEKSSKFHFVNDFLYKELEYDNTSNSSNANRYADRYYPEGFEEGLAHLEGLEQQPQDPAPVVRHNIGQEQQQQQQQQQQRQQQFQQHVPSRDVFHNADEVDIPFIRRHPPQPFDGPRLPHNQPTRFSDNQPTRFSDNQPTRFSDYDDFVDQRRHQG